MPRFYRTPGGQVYSLFSDMAAQPHLLIAGTTGSGKSTVINGILYNLLHRAPADAGLVLIDPKRVELVQYKSCPHVIRYATDIPDIVAALTYTTQVMETRYTMMARNHERKYAGGDIYVIIDELMDLMIQAKKTISPLIQRLAILGRASKIHVIIGTQSPLSQILPTEIKCCLDSRVGLRTRSAQDSRNILGFKGCESLPRVGRAYYMTPESVTLWEIPMYSDSDIDALIAYWHSDSCIVTVPDSASA